MKLISNIFTQVLENLKEKPAAYTIIALLILLGYLFGNKFSNENLRFWIMVIIYSIASIVLIIISLSPTANINKPKTINTKQESNNTDKLIYFTKLINMTLVSLETYYNIEFKKIEDNGIWIYFKLKQTIKNNSNDNIKRLFEINHYNRKVRNQTIKINSVIKVIENQPEYFTKKGLSFDFSIDANKSIEIEYSSDILYSEIDSDFFGILIPSYLLEFHIVNNIGKRLVYTMDKQYTARSNNDIIEESSNSKKLLLRNGALPFNGIFLKWKTLKTL